MLGYVRYGGWSAWRQYLFTLTNINSYRYLIYNWQCTPMFRSCTSWSCQYINASTSWPMPFGTLLHSFWCFYFCRLSCWGSSSQWKNHLRWDGCNNTLRDVAICAIWQTYEYSYERVKVTCSIGEYRVAVMRCKYNHHEPHVTTEGELPCRIAPRQLPHM